MAPAIARLQKWRQAGASRAASQREMEEAMVGRRADELAWLRALVAHEIPPDVLRRLVAHRGFHAPNDRSDRRPIENSLEAYELAWTSGVVLCECDVAVTRDGKLVLGHDADYSRLALRVPGEEAKRGLHVGELTLAQLIAMPLKSGSRPPTLLEVLRSASMVGNGSQLVIEIKPGNVTAADALIPLRGHPELLPCVGVVMSFDAFIMNDFAAMLSRSSPRRGPAPAGCRAPSRSPRDAARRLRPRFNPGGHMPRTSAAAQLSHYMVARDGRRPQEGPRVGCRRWRSRGGVAKGHGAEAAAARWRRSPSVEMWLDIMKDTAGVEEAAKHPTASTSSSNRRCSRRRAAPRSRSSRRGIGVWMRAERDPDLATATELMNSCGVSFARPAADVHRRRPRGVRRGQRREPDAALDFEQAAPGETGARSFKTKSSDEDSAISSPEEARRAAGGRGQARASANRPPPR